MDIFKSISQDPAGNQAITGYSSPSNDLRETYNLDLVHWDFVSSKQTILGTAKSFVECCKLVPDENLAIFFSSSTVPFSIHLSTGEQKDVFENLSGMVKCCQFSEDRSKILIGCKDGAVRLLGTKVGMLADLK